jgi:hypothetical protein
MGTLAARLVAVYLCVLRGQPGVGEAFERIEFWPGELRQVDHPDRMIDWIVRIAGNLHLVAVSLRVAGAVCSSTTCGCPA